MRQDPKSITMIKQFFKKITGFFQKVFNMIFNKPAKSRINLLPQNDDSDLQQDQSIQEKLANALENNQQIIQDSKENQQFNKNASSVTQESLFFKLPKYVQFTIMEHLSLPDFGKISQTCKQMNNCMQDEYPWKKLAQRNGFPLLISDFWYEGKVSHAKAELKNAITGSKLTYPQELIDLFGGIDKINSLPQLKYDNPSIPHYKTFLGLNCLTSMHLKGHKIMRGVGAIQHKNNIPFHVPFIAFCVTKNKKNILKGLDVYTLCYNHKTAALRLAHGSIGYPGKGAILDFLKKLLLNETVETFFYANGYDIRLTDQSEFDDEIKEHKRPSNK